MAAQVQEHPGQGGAQHAPQAAIAPQQAHHQFTRHAPQYPDKHNADNDSPPHLVEQFEDAASENARNRVVVVAHKRADRVGNSDNGQTGPEKIVATGRGFTTIVRAAAFLADTGDVGASRARAAIVRCRSRRMAGRYGW